MLYARELHEPLTEMPWNEAQARNAVQAIVADTERAYSAEALWPAHEWDGYGAALPLNTFYVGAAGVVWDCNACEREATSRRSTCRPWRSGRSSSFGPRRTTSLEQAQRLPGRYSLFTGSMGAALFAADCIDGRARYPVLDSLEPE